MLTRGAGRRRRRIWHRTPEQRRHGNNTTLSCWQIPLVSKRLCLWSVLFMIIAQHKVDKYPSMQTHNGLAVCLSGFRLIATGRWVWRRCFTLSSPIPCSDIQQETQSCKEQGTNLQRKDFPSLPCLLQLHYNIYIIKPILLNIIIYSPQWYEMKNL